MFSPLSVCLTVIATHCNFYDFLQGGGHISYKAVTYPGASRCWYTGFGTQTKYPRKNTNEHEVI